MSNIKKVWILLNNHELFEKKLNKFLNCFCLYIWIATREVAI